MPPAAVVISAAISPCRRIEHCNFYVFGTVRHSADRPARASASPGVRIQCTRPICAALQLWLFASHSLLSMAGSR